MIAFEGVFVERMGRRRRRQAHVVEDGNFGRGRPLGPRAPVSPRPSIGYDNHAGEQLMRQRIASLAVVLQVSDGVMQVHAMRLQERMDLHPLEAQE